MRSVSLKWARTRAFSLTVLIAWGMAIAAILTYLGQSCPVAGPTLTPAEARGWTLRYALSAGDRDGERLAENLVSRGRLPDLGLEVTIDGGSSWAERLSAAGWTARTAPPDSVPRPPRLDILDRQGNVVWSGALPVAALRVAGAQILDLALVARVVRGQPTPAQVPVGCAPRA